VERDEATEPITLPVRTLNKWIIICARNSLNKLIDELQELPLLDRRYTWTNVPRTNPP
jgi:hypothetical protein